ncbi:MAG: aminotransferase class I/II-fold pyridoxal phosphate-dependent enzyme, partial [Muribaculaceae bacterium]|nr:aminotransferase class I/II-fold pyridoxal phosphate-dependent enzyme [Muribaculaceae bacterium]
RFEHELERCLGASHVVALSSGTGAIHLCLDMLGVRPGDEVICQSLTFAASANPIVYLGARPVFVDSEPLTWNMDPELLERAILDRIAVTGHKPRAIVVVELYGMPAQLDRILHVADRYGIPVLEDSAEAIGSRFDGYFCGTMGRYGVLSFNGNKMITTSGGGALICPDRDSAERVKFLSTQARENRPYYYHEVIGYNYRLSNVSAAIGCGQIEALDDRLARRRAIHDMYAKAWKTSRYIRVHDNPSSRYDSNFWLSTIQLADESPVTPDFLRQKLAEMCIEARLIWRPMHMQPVYSGAPMYGGEVSERIFDRGLCLPSSSTLGDDDVARVIDAVDSIVGR